jgi:DeoR/GlpR family transcriptional regulator of sugar metabolism
MLAELRRLRIIEYIRQHESGVVSVAELSQTLAVSEMTIRRDLALLESKSILRRVHGGAIAYRATEGDKTFSDRSTRADPQKRIIGWLAAQLVQDDDRIILDAGTTTFQVAHNLTCKKQLTVITNNIPISKELSTCPSITIVLLGGIVKHNELCTVGNMVKQALSLLTADKYFLSATSFSIGMGAMETDMVETEVKQAMLRAAHEVILVADSFKFEATSLIQVAPINYIHKIVTDDGLPIETIYAIEAQGVEVITPLRQAYQPVPDEIQLLMDQTATPRGPVQGKETQPFRSYLG